MIGSAKVVTTTKTSNKVVIGYSPEQYENEYSFACKVLVQVLNHFDEIRCGSCDIVLTKDSVN